MNTAISTAAASGKVRTPWTEFWRKLRKQRLAMVAGCFVIALVAAAILAPWLAPFDPENYFDYDALNAPPSSAHWFGVDSLGRDIFSRVLMGARITLAAAITRAGGTASPCAFPTCCSPSLASCSLSASSPSSATA